MTKTARRTVPRLTYPQHFLTVSRCPVHREYWAISVDTDTGVGTGHGLRLTASKCCGQWKPVKRFKVDPEQLLKDIARWYS